MWMLKSPSITKGEPSSGKFESNKSNYSTKLTSGPGGRKTTTKYIFRG